MRSIFCFFLCIVLNWSATAQSSRQLDSLKRVLATLPPDGSSYQSDTTRVRVMCEMVLELSDFKKSDQILDQIEKIVQKRNWQEGKAQVLAYRGVILFKENLIYQSIENLYKALEIAEKLQKEALVCFCHRQLGSAYFVLEEAKLAIDYYTKAKNYYRQRTDPSSQKSFALMTSNIGLCHNLLKQYKQGIKAFQEAIQISHSLKDSMGLAWYYSNLGSTFKETQNYQDAIKNLNISLAYYGSKSIESQAFAMSEIALANLGLNQLSTAFQHITKAQEIAPKPSAYYNLYISKAAYEVFKANARYSEALRNKEVYDSLKQINDRLLQKRSVEGMQASFDNNKKQIQIDSQAQQSRYLTIGIVVAGILIIIILTVLFLLRKRNTQIAKQNKEIENINIQLATFNQALEDKVKLRTQELQKAYDDIKEATTKGQTYERQRMASELHDNLGGTLTAIKWQLAALDDNHMTSNEQRVYHNVLSMIQNAYADVRHISHNLLPTQFKEKGLIGAIEHLCMDISKSGKITIESKLEEIQGNIKPKVELELYSICLELITNILKHSQATQASIVFNKRHEFVHCQIQDNGIGLHVELRGKGLKNIQERLNSITTEHNLQLLNQSGLLVTFQIPLDVFFDEKEDLRTEKLI